MSDPIITPAVDATIAAHAPKVTAILGSGTGLAGYFQGVDWVTVTGVAMTIFAGIVSLIFKMLHNAREREQHRWQEQEHRARMRRYELESQMKMAAESTQEAVTK